MPGRLHRTDLLWLMLLAIALRLVPLFEARAGGLQGDEIVYQAQAAALVAGRGFVDTGEWFEPASFQLTAYRTPGLPAILAAFDTVRGHADPASSRVWLALFGTLGAPLAYAVAWRLWRDRWAAIAAGGSFALLHAPAVLGVRLLAEGPAATLVLAATWCLLWNRRDAALVAGLSGGVAVLCRPYLLPWLLVLPAWYLLRERRDLGLLVLATTLVLPVSWAARNAVQIGTFGLSTQTLSIWQGFSPFTDGRWPGAWERSHPQVTYLTARVPNIETLDEAARSRAFVQQAWHELRTHPGRAVALAPAKLRAWASPRSTLGVDHVWIVVALLAVGGFALLMWHGRFAEVLLVGGPIATTAFAVLITFGDERFRHPSDAMFCLFAAALVARLRGAWPAVDA